MNAAREGEGSGGRLRARVVCSGCGGTAQRRYALVPLGWIEFKAASGRVQSLCPDCLRRNLWLIEARLEIDPGDPRSGP